MQKLKIGPKTDTCTNKVNMQDTKPPPHTYWTHCPQCEREKTQK